MAAFGKGQHGKEETRKELSLIAMAHRNVYVLQSSQAAPSHLLGGVLRGLQSHYPAVFMLHSPCPPEHGLGDDAATEAAKLALETRAYPVMSYDPAEGETLSGRLSLDGNPSIQDIWPEYELKYRDADGNEATMEMPLTIADWAATEARFKKHFSPVPEDTNGDLSPFHEYLALKPEEREGLTPFIYVHQEGDRLGRLAASEEIVQLAEDRLEVWFQLKQMAGLEAADGVRDLVEGELEEEFDRKTEALRAEYEAKIADLRTRYPRVIARRMAEGLIRAGNGQRTVADLLDQVQSDPGLAPLRLEAGEADFSAAPAPSAAAAVAPAPAATAAPAAQVEEEEGLALEPWIEAARCTTCDECTNMNKRMFAYDKKKQAYIKDPRAGTFKELVLAAEKWPARSRNWSWRPRSARCRSSIRERRSTRRRKISRSG
jgi:pyruvate-ferredoxin/flavodoxin oxidoreductase